MYTNHSLTPEVNKHSVSPAPPQTFPQAAQWSARADDLRSNLRIEKHIVPQILCALGYGSDHRDSNDKLRDRRRPAGQLFQSHE
jgi:hypothetical protein